MRFLRFLKKKGENEKLGELCDGKTLYIGHLTLWLFYKMPPEDVNFNVTPIPGTELTTFMWFFYEKRHWRDFNLEVD
jgi:hypothetical protein